MQKDRPFTDFYKATQGQPPRELLLEVLSCFESEAEPGNARHAIDLGCGVGNDTFELLRRGWRVLAIDAQQEAIDRLEAGAPPGTDGRLQTAVKRFEQVELPRADLVYGGFSLSFCPPEVFDEFWRKIVDAIVPGGRFAGQLFGDRDEWSANPELSFHSEEEARALLTGFDIEIFREFDDDGKTAVGKSKHWHYFSIIARKQDGSLNET